MKTGQVEFLNINKDVLIYLSKSLTVKNIFNLSLTRKRINSILFSNNIFWKQKLYYDYIPNDTRKLSNTSDFLDIYKRIYLNESIFTEEIFDEYNRITKRNWRTNLRSIKVQIGLYYRYGKRILDFDMKLIFKENIDILEDISSNTTQNIPQHGRFIDFFMIKDLDAESESKVVKKLESIYMSSNVKSKKFNVFKKGNLDIEDCINIKNKKKKKLQSHKENTFLGKDILNLFHPLLLSEFEKYNIMIKDKKRNIINSNSIIYL
jgi:hypothetical protein